MDTYVTKTATSRSLVYSSFPLSPWTLRFLDPDRESTYSHSHVPPASNPARSVFLTGYVAVWILMVLATAGAYGLGNLSKDMCTLQLAILGILAATSFILYTLTRVGTSKKLRFLSQPALFLWAVLCYSVADERFAERLTVAGYSGSMSSCAIPVTVLFILLPEAINNRFLASLVAGAASVVTISVFQIAGVRVNSGMVDAVLYLLVVIATSWKTYIAERQQRIEFYMEAMQLPPNKDDLDTWGLIDEASSETDALLKKLREVHSTLSSVALLSSLKIQDRLKTSMLLLLDVAKDLSSKIRNSDLTTGLVSKAVDSEYRMFLEEKFLPVLANTPLSSKPRVHPIMYGSQELTPMLNQLEKNWNFDMFFLAQISGLRPLEVTGAFSVKRYALDSDLQLSEGRLLHFFQELESKYKPNPYHNSTHAADVLNSLLFLYKQSDIFKEITELELFGSIVAALGHDVGHPAFSNRYLINTRSSFALICTHYADNDVSVLEMMHAALTYELLNQEQVLDHLNREQWMTIRRIITEMILATDMMRHFEMVEIYRKKYAGRTLPFTDFEEKLALYKMCIKCADIAHAAKAVELHERWTMKVVEEFFHQGDLEREQNLPISMFCDRLQSDLPKNQSGFIINVVRPLFLAINSVLHSNSVEVCIIAQMETNLEYWKRRAERKKRASVVATGPMYITNTEGDEERKEFAGSVERAGTRVLVETNL